ncbi:MAG TPA: rubredoxin [Syntrophorhabdaceae bacterium]|jgi:rubredoxin|nr:rubredoxin [Syntrophorhabdaceae bacterium]
MVWKCTRCGYEYDNRVEKAPFEELPKNWHCPRCKAPKSAFAKKG